MQHTKHFLHRFRKNSSFIIKINMSDSRNVPQHWHTVYKISLISSPTKVINSEISEYESVECASATTNRLSLLLSNMQAEEETSLRSILTSKLNKSDMLLMSSEVLFVDKFIDGLPVQIYYCVVSEDSEEQHGDGYMFLVSFVIAVSTGFELFQADLDVYCSTLVPCLAKYMEAVDISEYITLLDMWFNKKVGFVERCLGYFPENLASLLCSSFCNDTILFADDVPDLVKTDIDSFLRCSTLSMLFAESDEETSCDLTSTTGNAQTISVSYDIATETCVLSQQSVSTTFCDECVGSMRAASHPIKMRQLIENYKLKSLQDMNTFKRLMRQAETDYYAVYKSYVFLVTSGNAYVILRNASSGNLPNAKHVIQVLERFIEQHGGFVAIDRTENKTILREKFSRGNFLKFS